MQFKYKFTRMPFALDSYDIIYPHVGTRKEAMLWDSPKGGALIKAHNGNQRETLPP
jgi:hypothetical protein